MLHSSAKNSRTLLCLFTEGANSECRNYSCGHSLFLARGGINYGWLGDRRMRHNGSDLCTWYNNINYFFARKPQNGIHTCRSAFLEKIFNISWLKIKIFLNNSAFYLNWKWILRYCLRPFSSLPKAHGYDLAILLIIFRACIVLKNQDLTTTWIETLLQKIYQAAHSASII